MINTLPAGLLSLLGLKSGLDSPKDLSQVLGLFIEALPFYLATSIKLDVSSAAITVNATNQVNYPALDTVPQGQMRYIELASAHLQYTSGAPVTINGWQITRSSGGNYPVSPPSGFGSMTSSSNLFEPFYGIYGLILQSGDRLGMWTTSGALSVGQINYGIRYADFIL